MRVLPCLLLTAAAFTQLSCDSQSDSVAPTSTGAGSLMGG
jgi:hypothetical protein